MAKENYRKRSNKRTKNTSKNTKSSRRSKPERPATPIERAGIQEDMPVIIQFEGEDYYVAVADLILYNSSLAIHKVAQSIRQTKNLVAEIEAGKLKPDLAIVDSQIEKTHGEGKQIAKKLRELIPDIKIIAYSILDDQDWGDYLAIKSNRDPQHTLIQGLEQLLGLEIKSGEVDRT